MSPTTPAPPGAGSPTTAADYSAQYAQYYGGADPYAAYGGKFNLLMQDSLYHSGSLELRHCLVIDSRFLPIV